MTTTVSQEFRKFARTCYTLRIILKDTLKYLDEIHKNLLFTVNLKKELLKQDLIPSIEHVHLECYPAFLIFGQNCHAKATFVNYLLDQPILPLHSSSWKWIRLSYGHNKEIFLTLKEEYEIVEKLKAYEKPWTTVPESDLLRNEEVPNEHCPALEIKLNSAFLKDKVNIIIPPDCSVDVLLELLEKNLYNTLPVIIYVVIDHVLNDLHIKEISKIKEVYQDLPTLFFVMTYDTDVLNSDSMTESEQHALDNKLFILKNQLKILGYISDFENLCFEDLQMDPSICTQMSNRCQIIGEYEGKSKFTKFLSIAFKSYLLNIATNLGKLHNHCLKILILTAFDMAREIQITPQRIKYAQASEVELYKNLMQIAGEKQEDITRIIHLTLQNMKSNITEVLTDQYNDYESEHCSSTSRMVTLEIQQLVLNKLGSAIAGQLVKSVGYLHESYTGTLQRCIENLEKTCYDQEGNLLASYAVTQIVSAAYSIELKSSTSLSLINLCLERLRELLHRFQMPWTSSSYQQYDLEWRKQVVINMIDSLSPAKLAKNVSIQFQEIVKSSHDAFLSAMRLLENRLSGKLEQAEEQRIAIRKQYAPHFAKLALESTSLCDLIQFGMPVQIREIGRGQYGVVFSCEPWGGISPCAIKSVVPPDERHWNDLAMEFYYTRTIPEHPRIVKLRGSVIDYQYGGGCSSAVLLIMERMARDLYCALRNGLSWQTRLQISIDVVEGIRYLHSQGLVHRDIKLKNVLLDTDDRAKLTDFGFCIPEAMMSGSIVGTPVHMAPELLSGHYDSSVDVYAFGILFWYICANQVSLPCVFEQFHNKEQLWSSVRKGVRPECLPHFSGECWILMEQCWAAEPSSRPLLGNVQPKLEKIRKLAMVDSTVKSTNQNCSPPYQRRKIPFVENGSLYEQCPLVQMREF